MFSDIKHWVLRHGGKNPDAAFYVNDVRELLQRRTEEEFEVVLKQRPQKWSASFLEYFEMEIRPHVGTQLGRWVLEKGISTILIPV